MFKILGDNFQKFSFDICKNCRKNIISYFDFLEWIYEIIYKSSCTDIDYIKIKYLFLGVVYLTIIIFITFSVIKYQIFILI